MVCEFAFTISSFADLLVWPTGCDYYFWLKILFAIMLIVAWTLYKVEKNTIPAGANFLSCLGVSALATLLLGLIGTLITNSANIPMIQPDVLLYILALTIPIILIWFFKSD